jgi:hypothetical protein
MQWTDVPPGKSVEILREQSVVHDAFVVFAPAGPAAVASTDEREACYVSGSGHGLSAPVPPQTDLESTGSTKMMDDVLQFEGVGSHRIFTPSAARYERTLRNQRCRRVKP